MITDKEFEDFFRSLENSEKELLTIEEFKHHIKKVQGTFSENE
jgi:hypothetical protein